MEAAAFFVVLTALSIVDIVTMVKKKLKKEIFPYLILALLAAGVGLFLFDPEVGSISKFFNGLFNLEG